MRTNKQKGVTITELLIYLGLMSIFFMVLLDIFTTTLKTKLSSESTSAVNQDSRYILSKLSYDVNNTDSVASPARGSEGSTLQLVKGGVSSTYSISSGDLVLTTAGIPMKLNSLETSLDSISFKNLGNPGGKPTIQVVYTVRSKVVLSGANKTQSVDTTVGLR